MSVIVQFSIFPVDKGESLSEYVADSIRIIEQSGLPYTIGPMGTSIEGQWDDIMAVITRCFNELSKKSSRVYLTMNADWRKDKDNRLTAKVDSVRKKLQGVV
jgi:uncharacterized protein (TIGR00106 family)